MQIDVITCATPNVAPATESTAPSPESTRTPGSFADLLDAVADEESEPAGEGDGEEPIGDEWMTVAVVVPFVPVIPQDVVAIEDADATSIEAIGEDVATDLLDAPLAEVAASPEVKAFVDGDAPKPTESKQVESSAANETPAPAIPSVGGRPVEIASDVRPEAAASGDRIDAATPIASKEPTATEPTAKPGKVGRAAPAPKTADVNDAVKAAAAEATVTSAVQSAINEAAASSPANNASNDQAQSPKGVAARFARAIERAIEHAVAPAVAAGESNQSSNQDGDGQSSFGEWLREQLPQLTAARAHNTANAAFALVAPAQNDARVSGLLASAGTNLPTNMPALPNEHDVTLQIVQSMRMQFRDGIGEAVLKLNPEHLGSVSISLRVENGGLKANVQADLPAVRQWLESQQDTLRSALAEHGLRLDRFDVEPDAQRQQADDNPRDAQSTRRRQPRRTAQDDEPVFEVVV